MTETMALTTAAWTPTPDADLAAALARIERGRGLIVRMADLRRGASTWPAASGCAGSAWRRVPAVRSPAWPKPPCRAPTTWRSSAWTARPPSSRAARLLSRAAVIGSGAVSGFVGLAGFVPDAAFTTLTIMREIARIAIAEGEDLSTEDARRACLEVFAFRSEGDPTRASSATSPPAWRCRAARSRRLLADVAARYGVVLGEKFGLQAVPLAGAVAGASLNAAFLDHYRNLAEAHFAIRRLEREHGRDDRAGRRRRAEEPRPRRAVHRCMNAQNDGRSHERTHEDDKLPPQSQAAQPGSEAGDGATPAIARWCATARPAAWPGAWR